MRRYVLATVLAWTAAGCGSDDRGVTQPTPQSVVVHNTLNPPNNRTSRVLYLSDLLNHTPGSLGFVDRRSYDDFTSAVTSDIRTVSWQGGYCGGGPSVREPARPPTATARSFQIAFYRDSNGPSWGGIPLYDVTLTPAEAHEQLTFDTGPTAGACDPRAPNASYYDYTAVLPTPFQITAGIRYWLMVRADMRETDGRWGWRVGMVDNSHSRLLGPEYALYTSTDDYAFSLSDP